MDLWLLDLDRPVPSRFTFGPTSNCHPAWSPDGSRIAFASDRSGPDDVYLKPTGGGTEETPLLVGGALFKEPYSWSVDGKAILFEQPDAKTGWDLCLLPVEGEHTPIAYLRTRFNERYGVVSPDGHRIAYHCDESGRGELYVQSFPSLGSKYQISTSGCRDAGNFGWARGGQELVFVAGDGLTVMAAEVKTSPAQSDAPKTLFRLGPDFVALDFAPDGQRIFAAAPTGQARSATITLELNWTAALKTP